MGQLISRGQATDYLSALIEMDLSFHSIEVVSTSLGIFSFQLLILFLIVFKVVNGLNLNATKEEDMPKEFVHRYISHCITSCERMDKFLQVRVRMHSKIDVGMTVSILFFKIRFVRLVCVLIQSLIRKGIVDIRDLFAEMQTFCLTFQRVKEANLLFRFRFLEFMIIFHS